MRRVTWLGLCAALMVAAPPAPADNYTDAVGIFKGAGESSEFFHSSYAYAVFPNIGQGGFLVAGELGKGRVYRHGRLLGYSTMGGLSLGFQAGGKVFTEIIFFADKRALETFESGQFEFTAGASATAITANAEASANTNGVEANASGSAQNATTAGAYQNGMAVFTVAKGGLMYAAAIGGQKFSYKPVGSPSG
jgi:lipid-binding SYLF domain-containing protein